MLGGGKTGEVVSTGCSAWKRADRGCWQTQQTCQTVKGRPSRVCASKGTDGGRQLKVDMIVLEEEKGRWGKCEMKAALKE